jgi:hypothetical protein
MGRGESCVERPIEFPEGENLPPVSYGSEEEDWGSTEGLPCHDCGVRPGGFHHLHCDVERCPKCGAQRHDQMAC